MATGCIAVALCGTAGLASGAPAHHAKHHKAKVPAIGAGDVTSTATAVRFPFYSHTGEDVEAEIPYATAMLASGAGQSVASILWPGETGANGGSTLQVLGITQVPTSVSQQLNDPEKAEAQTGVGKRVVTQSQPGVHETATAKPKHVSAEADGSASALPQVGKDFGTTNASTVIDVAKTAITSTAQSSVHDIDVAKVLKIGNVTSVATAATRGRTASGHATTTVSNATIAGIKVAIDDSGVHVTQQAKKGTVPPLPLGLGKKLPKAPSLDTIVNTALKQAGISVHLTRSTTKVHKAHVVLNSGALVIGVKSKSYNSSYNDTDDAVVFGGATLEAISAPGYPPPHIKPIKPITTPGGTKGTAGTAGTPGTPGTAGTTSAVGGGSSPDVAGSPTAGSGTGALAAASYRLFDGLKLWWIVLAGLGSGLIAFGLRRLPDRVLEGPGVSCPLEDA